MCGGSRMVKRTRRGEAGVVVRHAGGQRRWLAEGMLCGQAVVAVASMMALLVRAVLDGCLWPTKKTHAPSTRGRAERCGRATCTAQRGRCDASDCQSLAYDF